MPESKDRSKWEELLFSAFEKVSRAGSKDSVGQAKDWLKSAKQEVESRIAQEVARQLAQIDWNKLSKKWIDGVLKNYEFEIHSKVSFKPKKESPKREESD